MIQIKLSQNNYFPNIFNEEDTLNQLYLESNIYPTIDSLHPTIDGASHLLHVAQIDLSMST